MTVPQEAKEPVVEGSKEDNLVKQRKMYERQLQEEKTARLQLEEEMRQLKEAHKLPASVDEDDDSDEPSVDHKRLNKKLAKFEQSMDQKIEKKAEERARAIVEAEKKVAWLRANPDYEEIMSHANTMAEKDPEWAETILNMPNSFDRDKLVYKTIKAAGLNRKEEPKSNIQDKIEQNRRSPYYQPSGIANAPFANTGDFSPTGQKNAYQKMKELQNKLRI
jgi:hypothetical protein